MVLCVKENRPAWLSYSLTHAPQRALATLHLDSAARTLRCISSAPCHRARYSLPGKSAFRSRSYWRWKSRRTVTTLGNEPKPEEGVWALLKCQAATEYWILDIGCKGRCCSYCCLRRWKSHSLHGCGEGEGDRMARDRKKCLRCNRCPPCFCVASAAAIMRKVPVPQL